MIRVGSINGAWAVGGTKGVAVWAGEQAEVRVRIKIMTTHCRLRWKRLDCRKIIIKKGDPPEGGRPSRALDLHFFFESGHTAVRFSCTDIQRKGNFTTQRFLPDHCFDLGHQIQVLAQEIFGILTSLTETDISIGEEGTALLNDFEFRCQIEYVT